MTLQKMSLLCILILTLYGCKTEEIKTQLKNLHSSKIDTLIYSCHNRGIFNGNIIISNNDSIIYKKSFGYNDGTFRKKLAHNSIFNIGSIAKEFNAISIMMLVETGRLDIEQTLDTFDFNLPNWSKEVKIKHLLQYSSGLPQINYDNVKNNSDVFKDLRNLEELDFTPGTKHHYNNNSVFLQKRIIEKVTGQTFEEFVIQNIIGPLQLKDAVFDPKPTHPNFVKAFNNNKVNDSLSSGITSGWLHLSNEDLHRYLNKLHAEKIISNTSLNTLFKNAIENSQSSLGHSTFKGDTLLTHSHHGSSYNFEAFIYHNKETDLSITLTTNNKNFKLGEITEAIENILNNDTYKIPQKSVYLTIREKSYNDIDDGIRYYLRLKKDFSEHYNFLDPNELNHLGYKLIQRNEIKDAIKIFELMIAEFPNESNAYDSYGEALLLNKQYDQALINYKKSLELNPKNKNAENKIIELENR